MYSSFQIYIQVPSLSHLTTICSSSFMFHYSPLVHCRLWSMTSTSWLLPDPVCLFLAQCLVMLLCQQLHLDDVFTLSHTSWNLTAVFLCIMSPSILLFSVVTLHVHLMFFIMVNLWNAESFSFLFIPCWVKHSFGI